MNWRVSDELQLAKVEFDWETHTVNFGCEMDTYEKIIG